MFLTWLRTSSNTFWLSVSALTASARSNGATSFSPKPRERDSCRTKSFESQFCLKWSTRFQVNRVLVERILTSSATFPFSTTLRTSTRKAVLCSGPEITRKSDLAGDISHGPDFINHVSCILLKRRIQCFFECAPALAAMTCLTVLLEYQGK